MDAKESDRRSLERFVRDQAQKLKKRMDASRRVIAEMNRMERNQARKGLATK